MTKIYLPDMSDEWSKECLPLLQSKHLDLKKLKKKYQSLAYKRDESKKTYDLAESVHREDMLIYWDATYKHYRKLTDLMEKAFSDMGVCLSDLEKQYERSSQE